jgi:hypothetical protein
MPELRTSLDLAAVLGDVAAFQDPLAELTKRGFTLGCDLAGTAAKRPAVPPISAAKAAEITRIAAAMGKVTIAVGPGKGITQRFAAGDYDIIAGVRMVVANEILQGLYDSYTIPHVLALAWLLDAGSLQSLVAVLSGSLQGIPTGAQAGSFLISGAPTLNEVAGTDQVLVHIPFSLGFRLPQQSTDSASLAGTLSLVAEAQADVQIALKTLTFTLSLPRDIVSGPNLQIGASSSVQPISAQASAALAVTLQTLLGKFLVETLVISPVFSLPLLSTGITVIVSQVDVRTNSSPNGGVILVGIRFPGGPGTSDPAKLLAYTPDPARNLFLQVDQRYVQFELDLAKSNGTLDKLLSQVSGDNIRVDSVSTEFAPAEVIITISGVVKNACIFDVSFTVSLSLKFQLQGNQIVITRETTISVSKEDEIACLLTVFVISLIFILPAFFAAPLLGFFAAILFTGILVDSGFSGLSGSSTESIIDLDTPIPRTELLPVLSNLTSMAGEGVLAASATAAFRADDVNRFVYARFLGKPLTQAAASPLRGATVELWDQDAPRPAGDDSKVPAVGKHQTVTQKFITTTSTVFEPPTENELLGTASTDFDGRVMFVVKKGQGTFAGTLTTTVTSEPVGSHSPGAPVTQTHVSKEDVLEKFPDLFFQITGAEVNADTSKMAGGLFVNYSGKRLGTPVAPVTYTLSLQPPLTL